MKEIKKKVLLIVIDALTERILMPALEEDKFPFLSALKKRAQYTGPCISIFPSITHAALSSIATGTYPKTHGVIGSHWYMPEKKEIAYYSADMEVIFCEGIGNFVDDFVINLNHKRLQAPTIFDKAGEREWKTASLNFLIFHGPREHELNLPFLLDILPDSPSDQKMICGPDFLFLGGFTQSQHEEIESNLTDILHWYGLEDENTADLLKQFAAKQAFPAFTLAYFPYNDKLAHQEGPEHAHAELGNLDANLQEVVEAYGGLDAFLEEMCVIVVGDHSQSDISDDADAAGIDLEQVLDMYQLAEVGQPWESDDDLMVCPNMRAACVYLNSDIERETLLEPLMKESRIDQIIWRHDKVFTILPTQADGERFEFWRADEADDNDAETAKDIYGNHWSWKGDLELVDAKVDTTGIVRFSTYPNMFERVEGVLKSANSGPLWLTARPGHDFSLTHVEPHTGGGSHGSLHGLDSLSALLITGCPEDIELPIEPRITDITPLCLSILDY